MSPQCSLAPQEVKKKPVESLERWDAKLLGFQGKAHASEEPTFARTAAKLGWFARVGAVLGGGFLLFPRTPLEWPLIGA